MDNVVKMTLADQIYNILKEDIINQNIKCGEKLTSKILQERFNVSSTPIREALNRLGQEGLIDHITNVGGKVIEFNEKDINEIYDFCACLDLEALRLSMESIKKKELVLEINNSVRLQEKYLESDNIEEFMIESDNFHDILFRYADNSRLYNASKNIRSQFSILANIYQNLTVTKSVVLLEHKDIARAMKDNDFSKASFLMKNHFKHAKEYLLENIKKASIEN
ncbi:GntR family transcriptional regulator [Acidilutibacter cellobiosedens]|jgi:DNA-binding GntR family transcriptional regulator|uniref:GntR family transcriptional regulator n=1 Tax=Acidilutibacter cellobiosedens TaxID=2507161 RepID=A0A410QCP3_9FIRM|nr:GntR family transcriptional regulator [Acidilutibacter cellobiosedens]QAT61793.1 GntR family transcriptional regulator [Acidilutibacter cellobiosedens]